MKSRKAVLVAVPLTIIATLGLLVVAPTISAHYQVMDFYDKSGYQPEWVKGLTVNEIREQCDEPPTGDSRWCLEFTMKIVAERIKGNI